jgi:hypothetical protein
VRSTTLLSSSPLLVADRDGVCFVASHDDSSELIGFCFRTGRLFSVGAKQRRVKPSSYEFEEKKVRGGSRSTTSTVSTAFDAM